MPEVPDHGEILSAIGALKSDVKHIDDRLGRIDERLGKVEHVADFGKGAAWGLLRIGAVIAAGAVAIDWVRGHIRL